MTASLLPNGKQQFTDINGLPLVGGTVGMYVPATLVPKNTWQDAGQTVLNTNPITLDSRGQAIIYGVGTYRQILKDVLGNLIWDQLVSSPAQPAIFTTPEQFGAVGNGITDDTTACQAALNTGLDVFFAQKYFVSSALLPLSNQTLWGTGGQSVISMTANDTNCINLSAISNTNVRNLSFTNTGTNTHGNTNVGVCINGGSTYCNVSECEFNCSGSAVVIDSGSYCTVQNNLNKTTASGSNWDFGIYALTTPAAASTYNSFIGNRCFANQSAVGILMQAVNEDVLYCSAIGNTVYNKTQYGIIAYSFNASSPGVSQHQIIADNNIDSISGSFPQNPGPTHPYGAGIYLQQADYTAVTGNRISRTCANTDSFLLTPAGIGLANTSMATVTGNLIENVTQYGIMVASGDSPSGLGLGGVTVTGNNVNAAGNSGIFVLNQSNVTVTGNFVNSISGAQGIRVNGNGSQRSGISIADNVVKTCTAECILLAYVTDGSVIGNNCNAGSFGLSMGNCVRARIIGNNFENSTGTSDVQIDSTNSGAIIFDNNIVRSTATNGVLDSSTNGVAFGQNVVAGQTNTYAGTNALEPTLATSATPAVNLSRMVQYGGATAITDLTGGTPGQIVTIRATGNITIKNNAGTGNTNITNFVAADLSLKTGDATAHVSATYELKQTGGWVQIG